MRSQPNGPKRPRATDRARRHSAEHSEHTDDAAAGEPRAATGGAEEAAGGQEEAAAALSRLLEARGEWFLRERVDAPAVALGRGDWEARAAAGALTFSYWGEAGPRVWRVESWGRSGEGLRLEASRRTGAERATLELVPRASAASAVSALRAARLSVCDRLAGLVAGHSGLRVEAARLSAGARRGEPGRYARILLRGANDLGPQRDAGACEVAATGPVVPPGGVEPEGFLASALLWLARLDGGDGGGDACAARRGRSGGHGRRGRSGRRGGGGFAARRELWLVADPKLAAAVGERLALLRPALRDRIVLLELGEESRPLSPAPRPSLPELLARPAPRLFRPAEPRPGELFESLSALAPEAVDVVRSRHGETLRFRGLPFARARRLAGREAVWFGVGAASKRRLLEEGNREELLKLIAELAEHRRADAPARRHRFYRAAPEAWLESLLRRDITRLDPGLRLAPLHAQFRASRPGLAREARPVDLLALRRDGRLVVVELKVSEDAAFALQGADYWRRIEAHRRRGDVARARLFGDAEIADLPPLVYLVAPLLRFHRSFDAVARALSPEIETYRLDLNEDWRAGVRVARRSALNVG